MDACMYGDVFDWVSAVQCSGASHFLFCGKVGWGDGGIGLDRLSSPSPRLCVIAIPL